MKPEPQFDSVEQFEQAWLTTHESWGIGTMEELHAAGFFGYRRLHCTEPTCEGWHMGTRESYEMERQLAELASVARTAERGDR